MPSSRLPDRWEKYTNIGKVINGTRIITFKVPLNERLCSRYPEELWFTPDTLLETIKADGNQLGLVIDLTFTTRYYDYHVFTEKDIGYEKIFVPGKEVPSADIVEKFSSVIDEFISDPDNEGKLVGVHCTHGVNRTGHLVCRYMIDRLNFEPDKAIKAYAEARGYPIERENYLEDLRHNSGEDETGPPSELCPINEEDQLEPDGIQVKEKTAKTERRHEKDEHHSTVSPVRKKHRSGSQSKHHHHREYRNRRSQSPNTDRQTRPQDRDWRERDHQPHEDRQRPHSNYHRNNHSQSYDRQRSHTGNRSEDYNRDSRDSWRSHTDSYSENYNRSSGYNRQQGERQSFQRDRGNYGYNERRGNYGDYRNSQRSENSYNRGNGFRRTNSGSGNSYNRGPSNHGNWSLDRDSEYGNFGHRNHGNWSLNSDSEYGRFGHSYHGNNKS